MIEYVSGSVRIAVSRLTRAGSLAQRTQELVGDLARLVVGLLFGLDELDPVDELLEDVELGGGLYAHLVCESAGAEEERLAVAPAIPRHGGAELLEVAEVEVDLEKIAEEVAGLEAVLLRVGDLELLALGAGEDVEVVVHHAGEAVDDLPTDERRRRFLGEDREHAQGLVGESAEGPGGAFGLGELLVLVRLHVFGQRRPLGRSLELLELIDLLQLVEALVKEEGDLCALLSSPLK
jgi:hypothetical protein